MTQNSQIRVLIVDAIAASRKNICGLLLPLPDVEVVGIARGSAEAIRLAQALEPQVILFNPGPSHVEGLHTIRTLVAEMPAARIILVTATSEMQFLQQAMLAGARTFLAQPPKASNLADAIRQVSNAG